MMKFSKLGLLPPPVDVALGLPEPSAHFRAGWVPGPETPTQYLKVLCVFCIFCTDDSSTKVDMKDTYDAEASTL